MAQHEPNDADISRGCRRNDPEAWRYLVRQYTPLVYRIAWRILKDEASAEDVAQEVFFTVHRAITQHDPTRPLTPWLSRITYNSSLKRLAKTQKRAQTELTMDSTDTFEENNVPTPEDQVGQHQEARQVDAALDRLSAQDRGLVVMRYREGFSDSEIAQVVNIPVGTVKTRLFRARAKLKQYLAPYFKEVAP